MRSRFRKYDLDMIEDNNKEEKIYDGVDDGDDSRFYYEEKQEDNGDNSNSSGDGGKAHHGMLKCLLLLFMVMSNPVEGWKDFRRKRITSEMFSRDCFFPLCALVAVAQFFVFFYRDDIGLQKVLVDALIAFISMFFGYFATVLVGRLLIPGKNGSVFDSDFGKLFVMVAMSSLSLFSVMYKVLPMLEAVTVFLPLWTVYMVCRGVRFLDFRQDRSATSTFILCILVVGMPVAVGWILDKMLG